MACSSSYLDENQSTSETENNGMNGPAEDCGTMQSNPLRRVDPAEVGVLPALEQLGPGSLLHHSAVFQHVDEVADPQRGNPVRHDDHGLAAYEGSDGVLHEGF